MLEDAARLAIEGAGFVPVLEGSTADVTMQLGARITETDSSPFNDPFWYGGYGGRGPGRSATPPTAAAYWRRGYWGPGAWAPYTWGWGPYYDFPYYQREVALLIRDKRSGDPLYEARAVSEGNSAGIPGGAAGDVRRRAQGFPERQRRQSAPRDDSDGAVAVSRRRQLAASAISARRSPS